MPSQYLLGNGLIKGGLGCLWPWAGIRNMLFFQDALERAVLAEFAVQDDKGKVNIFECRQNTGTPDVYDLNRMAQTP